MTQTKQRTMPAQTIPTLLALSLPGARLLICSDSCYVLTKHAPKRITEKVYDAMSSAGWISLPEDRSAGIAECRLTSEGKRHAEQIKAARSAYRQPMLL